jgi:hypothetical protein
LPLANTSCCQVCSGLSPYSHRPCRAHKTKTRKTLILLVLHLRGLVPPAIE